MALMFLTVCGERTSRPLGTRLGRLGGVGKQGGIYTDFHIPCQFLDDRAVRLLTQAGLEIYRSQNRISGGLGSQAIRGLALPLLAGRLDLRAAQSCLRASHMLHFLSRSRFATLDQLLCPASCSKLVVDDVLLLLADGWQQSSVVLDEAAILSRSLVLLEPYRGNLPNSCQP
jgi:hypothetical protein